MLTAYMHKHYAKVKYNHRNLTTITITKNVNKIAYKNNYQALLLAHQLSIQIVSKHATTSIQVMQSKKELH